MDASFQAMLTSGFRTTLCFLSLRARLAIPLGKDHVCGHLDVRKIGSGYTFVFGNFFQTHTFSFAGATPCLVCLIGLGLVGLVGNSSGLGLSSWPPKLSETSENFTTVFEILWSANVSMLCVSAVQWCILSFSHGLVHFLRLLSKRSHTSLHSLRSVLCVLGLEGLGELDPPGSGGVTPRATCSEF